VRDWTSAENRIPIKRIESPRSIVDDATNSDKIKHKMRTIAIACNLVYFTRLDPVVLYASRFRALFSANIKFPWRFLSFDFYFNAVILRWAACSIYRSLPGRRII